MYRPVGRYWPVVWAIRTVVPATRRIEYLVVVIRIRVINYRVCGGVLFCLLLVLAVFRHFVINSLSRFCLGGDIVTIFVRVITGRLRAVDFQCLNRIGSGRW